MAFHDGQAGDVHTHIRITTYVSMYIRGLYFFIIIMLSPNFLLRACMARSP